MNEEYRKLLKEEILELLDIDHWIGWEELCENLRMAEPRARKLMQELKKEGRVGTAPVFTESGKLCGKGWFPLTPRP